ncbi:acyl-CoA carboxylase subunit beta [Pseudonocardia sp. ICBG1293]|uniref:acyl-CoA carboxylase subunit beta n=1 Tax=Pseudonocardia sp. ICBG1293 TaxID=2844382 RepID=UPI001CCBD974|nr:carboxyl transferase domain-containing protein [Pseudonocardia sp. ICBG1293]
MSQAVRARPDREPAADPADPRDPVARLALLADPGTRPRRVHDCDGAAWAHLQVRGAACVVFALDPRVAAGALGTEVCAAVVAAYDAAVAHRVPVVGIWHSSGARLQDGAQSLHAVAQIFAAMTAASGVVPQISLVVGPAAGVAAYGPALTDVVVATPQARMFVTGPDVVRAVTGEEITPAELGGADVHAARSGVVHHCDDEAGAIEAVRDLVALLRPARAPRDTAVPTGVRTGGEHPLSDLLPASPRRAYDMRGLLARLLDPGPVELHRDWAPNIVTTLGRLGGHRVGVVANNPLRKGGCLDALAAEKAARFVRMCDGFGIPLLVLVDVPGYLPGVEQEWDGVVRRCAKLLHAFAEATVPSVTVVLRKAFGGAYIAMNCRGLGADRVLAWPDAEIAVMGAPAAVRILHRRELRDHADPERRARELESDHVAATGGLAEALRLGLVDEIVEPDRTRAAVIEALRATRGAHPPRRGRHSNIPL